MTGHDRHLSGDSFAAYLATGIPMEHPIDGVPRLVLFFDPDNRRIGLRGPARPNETPVHTGLEHINMAVVHQSGHRMIEVAVEEPRLFVDAYPVLCGVADRTQLDNMTISRAFSETLRRLGHLIRAEQTLTQEVEAGLIGELCLLAGLCVTSTPEAALQAWRGGTEEHDFGLASLDVEVKTTMSETRRHRISSITQLQPTGDRPLWLLSLQLTDAGTGGSTVAEFVQRVRQMFPTAAQRDEFDLRTQAAGWRHRYADTPLHRWRLRTDPALHLVTAAFPRITPSQLLAAGVNLDAISDLRYRIDLTGRSADRAPAHLDNAVNAGRQELR
ncbi:PD-(D/E)XK motif protein [Actinoplanes hulinensis]|uniref:PD-(D/E)XK motif protein n=1 Tax=Actinoplanes hulinensis TaxID=1144547 RepID=A0ABS7BGJ4_9ACTN|nr:PD-(D/E)XK motif protein [Actinoplanes hulinensis]MBW6440022.1 PD-(D/E)XK motif protein [Actinoplanes hulinensis]